MIGDVMDFNKSRIEILSGEKRVIINFESVEEYYYWVENGMGFNRGVVFDYENKKIIEFLQWFERRIEMDLKNIDTKKLILELSTRPEVKAILVTDDQEFKVKIGATGYEYEGPYKIIIVEKWTSCGMEHISSIIQRLSIKNKFQEN